MGGGVFVDVIFRNLGVWFVIIVMVMLVVKLFVMG